MAVLAEDLVQNVFLAVWTLSLEHLAAGAGKDPQPTSDSDWPMGKAGFAVAVTPDIQQESVQEHIPPKAKDDTNGRKGEGGDFNKVYRLIGASSIIFWACDCSFTAASVPLRLLIPSEANCHSACLIF